MSAPLPPSTLPVQLHDKWNELAGACQQLGTLRPCDMKDLERFVLLSFEYDAITPKVLSAINHGDPQEANQWIVAQSNLQKQIKPLSVQFGLNSQVAKARGLLDE